LQNYLEDFEKKASSEGVATFNPPTETKLQFYYRKKSKKPLPIHQDPIAPAAGNLDFINFAIFTSQLDAVVKTVIPSPQENNYEEFGVASVILRSFRKSFKGSDAKKDVELTLNNLFKSCGIEDEFNIEDNYGINEPVQKVFFYYLSGLELLYRKLCFHLSLITKSLLEKNWKTTQMQKEKLI
jgi:hypothetical protein